MRLAPTVRPDNIRPDINLIFYSLSNKSDNKNKKSTTVQIYQLAIAVY